MTTLSVKDLLPEDGTKGTLVGRVWLPQANGPAVVAVRGDGVFDVTAKFPTVSALCEEDNPAKALAAVKGERIGDLEAIVANTAPDGRDPKKPWLLAPVDLQTLKAAGVTFAISMLERVIEERAQGQSGLGRSDPERSDAADRRRSVEAQARLGPGDAFEAGADRSERLEPVSRSRHRPGCRGLHQGADAVVGRHRHGCRAASEVDLEQPRAGAGAVRLEPRQDRRRRARQRRQSARLRGPFGAAVVEGQGQQRLVRHRPAAAPVRRQLHARRRPQARHQPEREGRGRFRPRRPFLDQHDQPRSDRSGRADHRQGASISRWLRAVPRHDVRAGQGSRCAGAGVHPQARRHRHDRGAPARQARQPHAHQRRVRALDVRHRRADEESGAAEADLAPLPFASPRTRGEPDCSKMQSG